MMAMRNEPTAAVASDAARNADALSAFVTRRDAAAFEGIVRRHGPMVMGVCRRILRDPHDAEDAFQAVFLVLARRASSVRNPHLLGNWLFGIAVRTARHLRRQRARTRTEHAGDVVANQSEAPSDEGIELRSILDEEISRLPRRYAEPIVLCYLDGHGREETARLLKRPVGTIATFLSRGKDLLRQRLGRRGYAVPAAALLTMLTEPSAQGEVTTPMITATAAVATGNPFAARADIAALAKGVINAMFLSKLVTTATILLVLVMLGGAGMLAANAAAERNAQAVKEVLDGYERTRNQARSWTMEVVSSIRVSYPTRPGEGEAASEYRLVYHRDRDRIDVSMPTSRAVVDGWCILYQRTPKDQPVDFVFYRSDGRKWAHRALQMFGAEAMDGFLADEYNLLDFFRAAKEVDASDGDLVDNKPCVKLDATVPEHGHWTVWFDPATGRLPRKMILRKSGSDVWNGIRLGEFDRFVPKGSTGPMKMTSVTHTVDSFTFGQIDGKTLPLSCRVVQEQRYADGNAKTLTSLCSREKINLHPDHPAAGAFVVNFSDGQPLVNEDDQTRKMVWRGGKPVAR
jgi:RNA polymerase sigma factor (sigma-70 family)